MAAKKKKSPFIADSAAFRKKAPPSGMEAIRKKTLSLRAARLKDAKKKR